jgi:Ca-activated chloride channel family protein
LIEGMARAGQGEPFVVLHPQMAAAAAKRFRKMIDAPVLTHVTARFEGFDAYDVEPIALPDVFAERPVVLFGKWRGEPKGGIALEGRTAAGLFRARLDVNGQKVSAQNQALRYLWARHRIAALSDQEALEGGQSQRERILDLGLKYNLLSAYTSFIAVDQIVRNPTADGFAIDQPSPLPQGVSDLAVGAAVPSTPEPAVWWLLLIAGVSLIFARRRVLAQVRR